MIKTYDYIIVGAGVAGLALAKELSLLDKKVLLLEKGGFVKRRGTIFDAAFFYDKLALAKSKEGTLIYRAFGIGGTSIVSCFNAIMPSQKEIFDLGINIAEELKEAYLQTGVTQDERLVGRASKKIMNVSNRLGYVTRIMPKFHTFGKCVYCGNCCIGCKDNIKWDAGRLLEEANIKNINIITNFTVEKIIQEKGVALGIIGKRFGVKTSKYYCNKVILSAGGLGTPAILQKSDIKAGRKLFIDIFNVTYGYIKGYNQRKEPSMSVLCDMFHEEDGLILSPFIDNINGFISCLEKKDIPMVFKYPNLLGIMTKINDDNKGRVYPNGKVSKIPTEKDLNKLRKGGDIAREILKECGVKDKKIFITKPRGAHPGGSAAIGDVVNPNLETAIKNLFVCDASIFPKPFGLPPMLTLIALAKWFAKKER